MNVSPSHQRRRRKAGAPPYRRVTQTLPLGRTPAIRQLLEAEGLLALNTPELREVYYAYVDQHHRRRDFCAVGWANENGGWEIRGPKFNGFIGRRGMSFIPGNSARLLIFPEMTGYLCWRYAHRNEKPSILILNHAEFTDAAGRRALYYASVIVFTENGPVSLYKADRHGAAA